MIGFATLAAVSTAHAEPSELERARTLFDQAGELEMQGQWSAAQDRLRDALRIRETPHLRYALGWALENGDRLIDARTEYDLALRLARRDSVIEVSRLAATRSAEVERKIPVIQIRVRGALARDTRVLVDGRELAMHGGSGTMQVDPGTRVVRIERSGQAPTEQAVSLTPGLLRIIDVSGDAGAVATADDGASDRARGPNRTLPYVLVGGGGALVLGSVLLFVSSASDASERDDGTRKWCDATACVGGAATRTETAEAAAYRREAYDAASRGNTKQIAGAIVGGVGLASIATGAYLLLTTGERASGSRAKTSIVGLDASPLPGGAMAGATLAF